MTDIKKYIRHIFWLFVIMFVSVTGYFVHFIFFVAPGITNSTLNPRVRINHEGRQRGNILDRNGQLLAYSENDQRHYPFGTAFAHVVGHTAVGHSGIEERYNFSLTNLSNQFFQRARHIAFERVMVGDNVQTTLDAGLQNHVYDILGTRRGSIIVMQPSTGNILAMVSYPTYDPNQVSENWSSLLNRADSPLINRATQGLYPPGSTFKTLTSSIAMRSYTNNFTNFTNHCMGYIIIDGNIIRCFNNVAHGHMDMTTAFALSCNTYFVALAYEIGAYDFIYYMQDYFIPINFSLAHSPSQFNLSHNEHIGYLMQTSIGQGRTLMTPLHMTLLTNAISNGGIMHMPNVVRERFSFFSIFADNSYTIFTPEQSEKLQYMMIQVVNQGTGANASLTNGQLAGKTGTAENDAGASHGWFTGFIVDQDLSITVILENSGGTANVLPMVRNIMSYAKGNQ